MRPACAAAGSTSMAATAHPTSARPAAHCQPVSQAARQPGSALMPPSLSPPPSPLPLAGMSKRYSINLLDCDILQAQVRDGPAPGSRSPAAWPGHHLLASWDAHTPAPLVEPVTRVPALSRFGPATAEVGELALSCWKTSCPASPLGGQGGAAHHGGRARQRALHVGPLAWLGWAGLGRAGLQAGLGWAGLGWAGLQAGLGWAGLQAGLGWAGLGCRLGWAGLGWAGLGWAGLGWAAREPAREILVGPSCLGLLCRWQVLVHPRPAPRQAAPAPPQPPGC
jgi:hypothetical protein